MPLLLFEPPPYSPDPATLTTPEKGVGGSVDLASLSTVVVHRNFRVRRGLRLNGQIAYSRLTLSFESIRLANLDGLT